MELHQNGFLHTALATEMELSHWQQKIRHTTHIAHTSPVARGIRLCTVCMCCEYMCDDYYTNLECGNGPTRQYK